MYKNILVPVSFGEERDGKGAIEVARTLADRGADLTLLHVIEQIPAHAQSFLPADYVTERRKAVEDQLNRLASDVPGARGVVVSGHASRAILDYCDSHAVDCVVIASHRPGMQDLLLGSTAAKVVRHSKCAVHVLR